MTPATTSLSLLESVRQGDSQGWSDFVHLYAPLVYNWCRGAALSPEESRDVSQDVFIAVAQTINRFQIQSSNASLRRWLKTITLNRCRDFHRRQKEIATGGSTALNVLVNIADESMPTDEDVDSDNPAEKSFLLRRAAEMVCSQFEERTWRAFYGVVIESRSTADVAADLGISPGAVRIAKCRVLSKLRQRLPELLID